MVYTGKAQWTAPSCKVWHSSHLLRLKKSQCWSFKQALTDLTKNMLMTSFEYTQELHKTYCAWSFHVCTLQDSTDNRSTDKFETSLEWQEYFSKFQCYNWCTPLSHPSSCMLVNHGPSQQSSKEEYKPWKLGATARYYASRTKTMLPTRKSVPRSSRHLTTQRPPDHRKETQTAVVCTCLPFIRSG